MTILVILDLDGTIYDERTYFLSGLQSVASFLYESFPDLRRRFPSDSVIYKHLVEIDGSHPRSEIFQHFLIENGIYTKQLINKMVQVYRTHKPRLAAYDDFKSGLCLLRQFRLAIITDGHRIVQRKKIQSLDIRHYFDRVYITHDYGVCSRKPSKKCFELASKNFEVPYSQMVYIGDDISKDFLPLNELGGRTVQIERVKKSGGSFMELSSQHSPKIKVNSFESSELEDYLWAN